jgi:murein L,D-transpeptidase YcbB/YkuD
VLRRDVTLEEALRLRLGAIEAHVASLKRVAAALRAAIRSGASEEDLRRLSMVTKLSKEERRKVIEDFFGKVMDGIPAADDWVKNMVEASVPDLPDDPTSEQLDAWIELTTILDDPSFVASMRAQATDFWSKDVDVAALQRSHAEFGRVASDARARGVDPTSEEAWTLVRGLIAKTAAAVGLDETKMTERMRQQYDRRAERYWELVAIMRGAPKPEGQLADYQWLGAAMRHHLAS